MRFGDSAVWSWQVRRATCLLHCPPAEVEDFAGPLRSEDVDRPLGPGLAPHRNEDQPFALAQGSRVGRDRDAFVAPVLLQPPHEAAGKPMRRSHAVQKPLPFRPLQHVHMGQIDPALFQTVTGGRIAFLVIETAATRFMGYRQKRSSFIRG